MLEQSNVILLEEDTPLPRPLSLVLLIDKREAANWQGRHGMPVVGIVEHIGVAPTFDSLVNYLVSANAPQVSATFVVGGDYVGQWALLVGSGITTRFLTESPLSEEYLIRAANHAGIESKPNNNPHPDWGNPNWWTIGKEHVGYPGQTWTEAMIQNDIDCNAYISTVVGRAAFTNILGHSDFDPINRAHCPGPSFPWGRIYTATKFRAPLLAQTLKMVPLGQLQALSVGDWDAYNELLKGKK